MRHLVFDKQEQGGFIVRNAEGEVLGEIWYYNDWKCYVWQQYDDVVMSWDCLVEIVDFIRRQDGLF